MVSNGCLFILLLGHVFGLGSAVSNMSRGVYEHYTEGGIKGGLRGQGENFFLNEKKLFLHSGALHYFRVHPHYWRDRLKKLRAAGLVAVETYIPWNLHNPYKDVFECGCGEEDMSPFLDIDLFLRTAKEEDLLVIARPGPYICAEWEFGGLPSWLLRETDIKVRTSDPTYIQAVKQYFDKLLPILREQQFTKGGPIIAFQIENEYGNTWEPNTEPDLAYLAAIKKMFEDHGLVELFFTSDSPSVGKKYGALPGVLMTANFNKNATSELTLLNSWQPDQPSMVMEYWSGWFDHWGEKHNTVNATDFAAVLEEILEFPAHVNFYMFHGGTSFGFLNGANIFKSFPYYVTDISSYDYDAPLTEAGDYTPKYHSTRAILLKHQGVELTVPDLPPETAKEKYPDVYATQFMKWRKIVDQVPPSDRQQSKQTMFMENLGINNNNGQSYGYVVYRAIVQSSTQEKVQLKLKDSLKGVAMVVVDGKRRTRPLTRVDDFNSFGYWIAKDSTMDLLVNCNGSVLDIVVENWGRINFGKLSEFNQTCGLAPEQVYVDGKVFQYWDIISLQFKGNWVKNLRDWSPLSLNASLEEPLQLEGPLLLSFDLIIGSEPNDTFIDMRGWGKGVVFVNGFNLGRFCSLGPARTLFVPAPLLKTGLNKIVVFEHFTVPKDDQRRVTLKFSSTAIFESITENPIKISFSSESEGLL